jgi:glycerol kinase
LPISTYFSAFKIRWLRENVKEIQDAVESSNALFCNMNTWLIYKLTNHSTFATDVTNASRMYLMDLNTLEYDEKLLGLFGV